MPLSPEFTTLLNWWPIIILIGSLPLLWYRDIQYRDIPYRYFFIILILTAPVTIMRYIIGDFNWETGIITLLPCLMYYVLMRKGFFYGDDMIFLWILSLSCIVNPLKPESGGMPITLMLYMIGVMVLCFGINFMLNTIKRRKIIKNMSKNKQLPDIIKDMAKVATDYGDRGIPMMIPIGIAFILAVVL